MSTARWAGSTVIFINSPAGATLSPDGKTLTVPGEGVYTVLPTGEITFSPAANFSGTTTSVTYQVADNDGARTSANILISVSEVNDAPDRDERFADDKRRHAGDV
ncbi:MAG: Ig-like domain-containing protein [Pirellulaceae bacterium]